MFTRKVGSLSPGYTELHPRTQTLHGNRCDNRRYNTQYIISTLTQPLLGFEILLTYTDLEARVRFPALPEKKVVGLERGPLSLVSTAEELLDRKIAAPV
jgi:hypothetical protein